MSHLGQDAYPFYDALMNAKAASPCREPTSQRPPSRSFSLSWELLPAAGPRLAEIASAVSGAPLLVLATDPDREGEAISWHIVEELRVGWCAKTHCICGKEG